MNDTFSNGSSHSAWEGDSKRSPARDIGSRSVERKPYGAPYQTPLGVSYLQARPTDAARTPSGVSRVWQHSSGRQQKETPKGVQPASPCGCYRQETPTEPAASRSLVYMFLGPGSGFIYTFGESSIARERTLMVEESPPPSPPAEESIEAETYTALEQGAAPVEATPAKPVFVCDCGVSMRSACEGLSFYKEHERRRYCVLHYPGKDKSADFKAALAYKLNSKDFDFRGVWFPDEVSLSGFEFSAAADFRSATFSEDASFSSATFSANANFVSATFGSHALFRSTRFNADAYFRSATFRASVNFESARFGAAANFISADFKAAVTFAAATFCAAALFTYAYFTSADFDSVRFMAGAHFLSVTFSAEADFSPTTFAAATYFNLSVFHAKGDFGGAEFCDSLHFLGSAKDRELNDGSRLSARGLGENPSLDFQHARIEHPDRIAFHTLNLRPHWFVNVDPRQFIFTDVSWKWDRISIKQEIAALEANEVSSPNRLLVIACRQLAENAETNNRYEEASKFRYWAMDLARRTKWKRWRFWETDWLHMLYWAVSGYGEKILRALGVLAAVWLVFVLLYTQVGFVQQPAKTSSEGASSETAIITIEDRTGKPLEFSRALTYSLAVMSLQKPEPKPLTGRRKRSCCSKPFSGPCKPRCSRSPFDASSCAESKLAKETPKGVLSTLCLCASIDRRLLRSLPFESD